MRPAVTAWNRWPVFRDQTVIRLYDRDAPLPQPGKPCVAHGNGRSYSDVCLNDGGCLLDTRALDRFISFDRDTGRVCCEAGVLLADVVRLAVPQGWFLPVTPGTLQVTVGGAIANDVHGKNHHVAGSFGRHVRKLALRRSDGELKICCRDVEPSWFAATVGGLGLTGIILWAEIQLLAIEGEQMELQSTRFECLDDFWAINDEATGRWPYTVAWIDCLSQSRRGLGRGWLHCGRHARAIPRGADRPGASRRIPFEPPVSLVDLLLLGEDRQVVTERATGNWVVHYRGTEKSKIVEKLGNDVIGNRVAYVNCGSFLKSLAFGRGRHPHW